MTLEHHVLLWLLCLPLVSAIVVWCLGPTRGPAIRAVSLVSSLLVLLLCCHPDLPRSGQVALTLRAVAGLTTPSMADASSGSSKRWASSSHEMSTSSGSRVHRLGTMAMSSNPYA